MKFVAAVLVFTSALALSSPAVDANSDVEAVETTQADSDGDGKPATAEATVRAASPTEDSLTAAALTARAGTEPDSLATSAPTFGASGF
ncbi:hypothetical protein HIM_06847 [Hirsutella minnesotensis 3608]|uniref:Secreted protein n=1 Tax=Hirsutella minnesotensis 3608 TaxID=1043627 RepID=A0A0F8A4K3_9HYPO|nr:hypothetical protein HIM_06847 [Hirsutella minnesotensis 3608]